MYHESEAAIQPRKGVAGIHQHVRIPVLAFYRGPAVACTPLLYSLLCIYFSMAASIVHDKRNWQIHVLYVRHQFDECLSVIEAQLKENKFCEYPIYVKGTPCACTLLVDMHFAAFASRRLLALVPGLFIRCSLLFSTMQSNFYIFYI